MLSPKHKPQILISSYLTGHSALFLVTSSPLQKTTNKEYRAMEVSTLINPVEDLLENPEHLTSENYPQK